MKERRERGLCYNCDEKFSPGHRCKVQKLYLMEGNWPVESIDEPTIETAVEQADDLPDHQEDTPEISFHAIAGSTTPQTMQMKGSLGRHPLVILIDSGSTHNFLDPKVVKKARLSIQGSSAMEVMVATGERLPSKGMCVDVTLTIQGSLITTDFYLLSLGGCDALLGAHWLRTLGPILWDFSNLWMKFTLQGIPYNFKGEVAKELTVIDDGDLKHAVKKNKHGLLLQLCSVIGFQPNPTSNPKLTNLLAEFNDVFETPKGLPPSRANDHRIPLLEGTRPINVRPYRYPHYQKNEIEKIVKEMLHAGIVRPSQSPFSSPVLLVRKRDGSWRVCVDYRALNRATIKDKFPILVIDELLDELHGTVIFSKLDLRSRYH